jgi:predicted ArsR family transcriptional regulator
MKILTLKLYRQRSTKQSDNTIMDAKETVLEVLKKEGEPMSAGQVAEKSGLDRKVVDKAMNALKAEELIVSPRRCYWIPKQ